MIQLNKHWQTGRMSTQTGIFWLLHIKCSKTNLKLKEKRGSLPWINYGTCSNCYAQAPKKVIKKAKFILNNVNNGL